MQHWRRRRRRPLRCLRRSRAASDGRRTVYGRCWPLQWRSAQLGKAYPSSEPGEASNSQCTHGRPRRADRATHDTEACSRSDPARNPTRGPGQAAVARHTSDGAVYTLFFQCAGQVKIGNRSAVSQRAAAMSARSRQCSSSSTAFGWMAELTPSAGRMHRASCRGGRAPGTKVTFFSPAAAIKIPQVGGNRKRKITEREREV